MHSNPRHSNWAPLSKLGTWAVPAIVFIVALTVRYGLLFFIDRYADDSFIGFRVARNLALGNGFVFNLGDRVQASTTPLWIVFSSLVWLVFGSAGAPLFLRLIGGLADALCAALISRIVADGSDSPSRTQASAFAGLFYAGMSTVALIPTIGMETGIYCLVLAGSYRLAQTKRYALSGVVAALSVLLHPEGVLIAGITGLMALRDRRVVRFAASFLITISPYPIFYLTYFTSLLPQTVVAKKFIDNTIDPPLRGLLSNFFLAGPLQWALLAIYALGFYELVRTRRNLWLVAWGWLYFFFFSFMSPALFPWYLPPFVIAYAAAIGEGIAKILSLLSERWKVGALVFRFWPAVAAAMALILVGDTSKKAVTSLVHGKDISHWQIKQVKEVAAWVNANTPPEATVLVEMLGMYGFEINRSFHDYPGLASPQVTAALKTFGRKVWMNPGDTPALAHILERVKPDVVVLRELSEFQPALKQGALDAYEVVMTARVPPECTAESRGCQDMVVSVRKH